MTFDELKLWLVKNFGNATIQETVSGLSGVSFTPRQLDYMVDCICTGRFGNYPNMVLAIVTTLEFSDTQMHRLYSFYPNVIVSHCNLSERFLNYILFEEECYIGQQRVHDVFRQPNCTDAMRVRYNLLHGI